MLLTKQQIKKFNELYAVCFDENDQIKCCGREACKNLISFLGDTRGRYGDAETGILNIPNVVKLHKNLNA